MGRRNERDSAGMDSSLPWAQPGGYQGSEYGAHGPSGYPPAPYPYDSSEHPPADPNGLPYPPPGPQGYPPGMYPEAAAAAAAASEAVAAAEESDEERCVLGGFHQTRYMMRSGGNVLMVWSAAGHSSTLSQAGHDTSRKRYHISMPGYPGLVDALELRSLIPKRLAGNKPKCLCAWYRSITCRRQAGFLKTTESVSLKPPEEWVMWILYVINWQAF